MRDFFPGLKHALHLLRRELLLILELGGKQIFNSHLLNQDSAELGGGALWLFWNPPGASELEADSQHVIFVWSMGLSLLLTTR